jgi:CheY-like chemotaxis protein
VDLARNGKEATELAPQEPYDLILMDIQMPVMDGYEATKIIRENGFKAAIFALTASISELEEDEQKPVGFDDYIAKPFTAEVIMARFEKYLESK